MSGTPATRPAESGALVQRVFGPRTDSTSFNGLPRSQWSVRCSRCGNRRVHNSDGLRKCPCGAMYEVCTGAVIN